MTIHNGKRGRLLYSRRTWYAVRVLYLVYEYCTYYVIVSRGKAVSAAGSYEYTAVPDIRLIV